VVDISSRFIRPATYGDVVDVHTSVIEWNEKSFVMLHQLKRNGELLAEGRDTRVFAIRHPDDPESHQGDSDSGRHQTTVQLTSQVGSTQTSTDK